MNKSDVRDALVQAGIIPGIRVMSSAHARFAAEAVNSGGIPVAEITMTVPGAVEVIADLARSHPEMIVGAGTVLDAETAGRAADAGARFLTSPGLVLEVVEFAIKNDVVVFPGALTPTDVITAWKAGADFVKIFPCGPVGGHHYIRALKAPLPQVPLIASGGVNLQTAGNFILAGAAALGIGADLIPPEAIRLRQETRIHELARRFLNMVKEARAEEAHGSILR